MEDQAQEVILYAHPACPGVGPVKAILDQAGVAYNYVNIHRDREAAVRVRSINQGYESVPTLIFPDGSSLTEPSVRALKAKLESLGYEVGWQVWIVGNFWRIIIYGVVIFALLRFFELI